MKYPSIANFSINLTAALKLGEEGKLRPGAHICTYLPHCPATWMPLTVRQVVDGTSGLPAINWGLLPGAPAQSLSSCQTSGLEVPPFGRTDFQNCDMIVLGTIIEKITHQPWEAAIRRTVLDPTGMHNTARLTDALKPPGRADDYNGSASGAAFFYGPYFELYSTAPDILRYDDALFGGKLLSAADLRAALTPRDASPDPGIPDARNASLDFKIGRLAGQSVIYRYGTTDLNFTGINMYFPGDGVTIVVASNVRQDDALPIGVNLAKLLYGRTVIFPVPQGHIPSAPPARAIQATIDVQTNVSGLALAHHAIWLGNDNIGTVTRVNTRTNQAGGITPLSQVLVGPPGYVGAVAAEGEQVWVDYNGGQEVMRLDPVTGKVAQRVRVASLLGDMSIANGILWATSATDNVRRIDPRSGRVERVGRAFGLPEELATGGGSVWVSSRRSATVRRIDARTGRIVATIHVGTDPETVALGYGSVWVANGTGGYVSRIDPRTNKVVTQIAVGHDELVTGGGPCCHDIAVGYGAVWVAVHRDHKLVRIDPTTNRATSQLTLPIPPQLTSIDVWDVLTGEASVWVHAEPHLLYRIDPKAMA